MKLVLALVLLSIAIVAAIVATTRIDRGLHLVAVLAAANGVREGTPISYLGVEIGRVERLRIDKRPVIADLRITRADATLRQGDHLRLEDYGIFGDKVLAVVQGNGSGRILQSDDTLAFAPAAPSVDRLHPRGHDIGRVAVDRLGPDEIADALGGVAPSAHGVVFPGSRDDHAQYIYNRRTTASDVEQHDEWDDILIVQSGRGVIRHGGTWRNAKAIYEGERRGGSLVDPQDIEVAGGDVVRIPAREPHRIVPSDGGTLVYLVVKVRVDGRK